MSLCCCTQSTGVATMQILTAVDHARRSPRKHSHAIFQLLLSNSKLFSTNQGSSPALWTCKATLREANDLALEYCGYTREQVVDRPFWDTPWWRGSEETKAKIASRRIKLPQD